MEYQKYSEAEMHEAFQECVLTIDRYYYFLPEQAEMHEKIYARKKLLNKRFELTPENIEKLKQLNLQLIQIIEKAQRECTAIKKLVRVQSPEYIPARCGVV